MNGACRLTGCIIISLFCILPHTDTVNADATVLQEISPEHAGFSQKRLERITTFIQSAIDDSLLPGAVAKIARDGRTVYSASFGMLDIQDRNPMCEDGIFRIASMSKPIICTAAMILYEEGKFLLTDPVSNYIPAFKNPLVYVQVAGTDTFDTVPASHEITIRNLMNHTSGLSYGRGPQAIPYKEAGMTVGLEPTDGTIGEMVERLAKIPLLHNPGEEFTYGLSIDVLGYLIEVVSGMPLDQFLEERIFQPLGMKNTGFYVPEDKQDRFASLYRLHPDGSIDSSTPQFPEKTMVYFSGGAGLRSTAPDYLRFAQMILDKGELNGIRILSRKSIELMSSNSIGDLYSAFRENSGDKYGLGLGIRTERGEYDGIESLGILGWDGAFFTRFWIDPAEELVFVCMCQIRPRGWDFHNKLRALVYQAIND